MVGLAYNSSFDDDVLPLSYYMGSSIILFIPEFNLLKDKWSLPISLSLFNEVDSY